MSWNFIGFQHFSKFQHLETIIKGSCGVLESSESLGTVFYNKRKRLCRFSFQRGALHSAQFFSWHQQCHGKSSAATGDLCAFQIQKIVRILRETAVTHVFPKGQIRKISVAKLNIVPQNDGWLEDVSRLSSWVPGNFSG